VSSYIAVSCDSITFLPIALTDLYSSAGIGTRMLSTGCKSVYGCDLADVGAERIKDCSPAEPP